MLRRLLARPLRRALLRLRNAALASFLIARAKRRLTKTRAQRQHRLPGELIVSLTSYPARFGTLHLTLACLLDQTVRPDRVILWIAHRDIEKVPQKVRALEGHGLEIRACDDLRSFKKLVPALEAFPNAYIATADDDLYYFADWLGGLVNGALAITGIITCRRAHRMKFRADSWRLAPYLDWDFDVQDSRSRQPSRDILPTGSGGILYPPHCLHPQVTDRALFQRLCPNGDDLWFYWCARLHGTLYGKVGGKMPRFNWPGTEESSLWTVNEAGENDRAIRALEEEFGRLP